MKIPLKHDCQQNGPDEEEDGDDVGEKEEEGEESHSGCGTSEEGI